MKVAVELDALADTRGLWQAWLEDASRRYDSIAGLDTATLPADRAAAAEELDRWAERGIGDWRSVAGALRREHCTRARAARRGRRRCAARRLRAGVFTDAPEPLARVVLAQLGADRRIEALETGEGALGRLLARLGDAEVGANTRRACSGAANYDPVRGAQGAS